MVDYQNRRQILVRDAEELLDFYDRMWSLIAESGFSDIEILGLLDRLKFEVLAQSERDDNEE